MARALSGASCAAARLLLALATISCVGLVAAQEICPGCTDVAPAGDFTCEEQKNFGKCSSEWMIDGQYCEFSCERCFCTQVDAGTSLLQPTPGVTPDETVADGSDGLAAGGDLDADAVGGAVDAGDGADADVGVANGDSAAGTFFGGDDEDAAGGDDTVDDVLGTVDDDLGTVADDLGTADVGGDEDVADDFDADAADVPDAADDGAARVANENLVPLARLGDDEGGCENTVFTAVASAKELTTLTSLLEAAGLDDVLDDESLEVTLFAPSDKGFDNFAKDQKTTSDQLAGEDMIDTTSTILQYHVATQVLTARDLEKPAAIETLVKKSPLFGGEEDEIEGLGSEANIVGKAVRVCNSLVYLVDNVLLPGTSLEAIGEQEKDADAEDNKEKAGKCSPGVGPMFAISSDADLSTFTEALNFAQLSGGLATADEELTILAPTNDAFDNILKRMNIDLPKLLEDMDTLTGILEYHIIEENLDARAFAKGELEEFDTVNGTVLLVERFGNSIEFAGTGTSASVSDSDIDEACNAAVHKIDAVLLPYELPSGSAVRTATPDAAPQAPNPSAKSKEEEEEEEKEEEAPCQIDLWRAINSSPDLTTLAQIMEFADVDVLLQNKDLEITLFAPSDTAWGALLPKGLGFFDLIPDVSVADVLLSYHIVGAPVPTRAFKDGFKIPTLLAQKGEPLSLTTVEKDPTIPNQFTLNGEVGSALFLRNDIIVCKSVIHVIDTVLLPDEDVVTSATGTTDTAIETAEEFEPMIAIARDGDPDAAVDEDEPVKKNNRRTTG